MMRTGSVCVSRVSRGSSAIAVKIIITTSAYMGAGRF